MGEPDEVWETRIGLLKKYQVNAEVMKLAKDTAIFMHCLPSFHDTNTTVGAQIAEKFGITEMEVTDEVFESVHRGTVVILRCNPVLLCSFISCVRRIYKHLLCKIRGEKY